VNIRLPAAGSAPPGRFHQQPSVGVSARATRHDATRAVRISSTAQQLSDLQSDDADVRLDRINALRAALATGTLSIDTARIADGLIESARELLSEEVCRARIAR